MMSLGGSQLEVAKRILLILDGAEKPMRYTPLMKQVLLRGATETPFKITLAKLKDQAFVTQINRRGPYTITERGRALLKALKARRNLSELALGMKTIR